MVIKYIVLLFFIYSFGIAKTIDDEVTSLEIRIVWNSIRFGFNYVNEEMLCKLLEHLNTYEVKQLLKRYGRLKFSYMFMKKRATSEWRMSWSLFKKFARDGHMPRWLIVDMKDVFYTILPQHENRIYVTLDEMIKHYPKISSYKLERMMRRYGKMEEGEHRLYFEGFAIIMNRGYIPPPPPKCLKNY